MIPKIDLDIGLGTYSTSYKGCGGKIKENVGDFTVSEELTTQALESISDTGTYAVFIMRKSGMDTTHALQRIQKNTGQRLKPLGLKDAQAVTQQYVCATSKNVKLDEYSDGNVSLTPAGYTQRPLSGKDMKRNVFAITLREHDNTLHEFTEWNKVLNFYGYQRFGSSHTQTHLVGHAIITGNWKKATELILSYISPYESDKSKELRQQIAECKTYKDMLKLLPHKMDLERIIAIQLDKKNDPLSALRHITVQMRRFYVQAYQSYIFNLALSIEVQSGQILEPKEGDVCYGENDKLGRYSNNKEQQLAMPLVGHSYYTKTRLSGSIKKVLKEQEISSCNFAIKDMQEASAEGGFRTVSLRTTRTSIESDTVHVALGRGSYATMLLREIIKSSDPVKAGLAT